MEDYQEELALIKIILKNNPKGMTVTDIAREIDINRNSVAKYLDILVISGHAEMITFGPAKVFFPSRRIPISSLINYISDYIIILDENLRILQVNDVCLQFFNTQKEDIIGEEIHKTILPRLHAETLYAKVKDALTGKEYYIELTIQLDEGIVYFQVHLLPTTFEDGRQGVTCILTNITEKKHIEQAFRGNKNKLPPQK
ncbi:MAG: PAS domain-containing protein [Methanobacteriota archaeon]